jgi:hypothetical protein
MAAILKPPEIDPPRPVRRELLAPEAASNLQGFQDESFHAFPVDVWNYHELPRDGDNAPPARESVEKAGTRRDLAGAAGH